MGGLLAPKTQAVSTVAPVIGSLQLQTSVLGKPIPWIMGTVRVPANLIWYGGFTATPHTENSSSAGGGGGSGGGGGGDGATNTYYTYSASLLMALGEGQVNAINAVWRGKGSWRTLVDRSVQVTVTEAFTIDASCSATVAHAAQFLADGGVTSGGAKVWDASPAYPYYATVADSDGPYNTEYCYSQDGAGNYTFNVQFVGQVVSVTYTYKDYSLSTALGQLGFTLFEGTYVQTPFGYVTSNYPAQALGYRGIAYVAASGYELGTNATLDNHSFEVETSLAYGAVNSLAKTFTANVGTQLLTATAHGFSDGRCLRLASSGGALPVGFTEYRNYFVINATTNTFQVAELPHGTAVEFSTAGTGTLSATPWLPDTTVSAALSAVLTNTRHGAGFPSSKLGDLSALEAYSLASGVMVSPAWSDAEPASALVTRLMTLGYAGIFFSEDQLKCVPFADETLTGNGVTYTPVTTVRYALTDGAFLSDGDEDPVRVTRKDPADVYNQVTVKCRDRGNDYNETKVMAQDLASIDALGLRPAPEVALLEIVDPEVAKWVAQLILLRYQAVQQTFEFKLPGQYLLIEPMDLLSLTETSGTPLVGVVVRVTHVAEDEGTGDLTVTAENYTAGSGTAEAYPAQAAQGYVADYNTSPGDVSAPVIFDAPAQYVSNAYSVMLALASASSDWGGCEVWASYDNSNYQRIGSFYGRSRFGYLTTELPVAADPDVTNSVSVDLSDSLGSLLGVTQSECDNLLSLCWVGGELIAYQDATLTSAYNYTLGTRLRRGALDTPPETAHPIGTPFVRLDTVSGSLFVYTYNDYSKIGQTIYFKLPSFNVHGSGLQGLDEVRAYSFVIGGPIGVPDMPSPLRLRLYNSDDNYTFAGRDAKFLWDPASATTPTVLGSEPVRSGQLSAGSGAAGAGQLDPFFKDYLVRVHEVGGSGEVSTFLREEAVTVPYYTYTWEKNAEDQTRLADGVPSLPVRSFWQSVYVRGGLGQISALPAMLQVTNPALSFTNLAATPTGNGVLFDFDLPLETDYAGASFYLSETPGFTPSSANRVYNGSDNHAVITGLKSSTTYYYRATINDTFGPSDYTAEASFTTLKNTAQAVGAQNTGDYNLGAYGTTNSGRVALGYALITSYPSLVPSSLRANVSGILNGAVSDSTITSVVVYAKAVTSQPASAGTLSVSYSAPDSFYSVVGVGTDFTAYAANDWVYIGAGYPLFSVLSVQDATHMRVRIFPNPPSLAALTISGVSFTVYRGTNVTLASGGFVQVMDIGASLPFYRPASATLSTEGASQIVVVALGGTEGGEVYATHTMVEAQWILGA